MYIFTKLLSLSLFYIVLLYTLLLFLRIVLFYRFVPAFFLLFSRFDKFITNKFRTHT